MEQNIHVIDVGNWFLGAHPVQALGTGRRTDWSGTPYNTGDAYDHFAVTYWYPDDVHASFSSNQLTPAYSDLCVRCFGHDGCADLHYGGLGRITEKNEWMGAERDPTFKEGAVSNAQRGSGKGPWGQFAHLTGMGNSIRVAVRIASYTVYGIMQSVFSPAARRRTAVQQQDAERCGR